MSDTTDSSDPVLSPEGLMAVVAMAVDTMPRVASAVVDGKTIWIKRYGVRRPVAKWLHVRLSPLAPAAAMRASPWLDAAGLIDRERRKIASFRAAGFAAPHVLFSNDRTLVLSDAGRDLERMLKPMRAADPDGHDLLLVEMTGVLAAAHRSGLCHGRPHPRDMFLSDGKWGFIDFEEEPEASMPLAAAQARDVWVLFLSICRLAQSSETPQRALAAYLAVCPANVVPELETIVRVTSPLLPVLRLLQPVGLGADGRRLLVAGRFLRQALEALNEDKMSARSAAGPATLSRDHHGRHV